MFFHRSLTILLFCTFYFFISNTPLHSQERDDKIRISKIWISGNLRYDIEGVLYSLTDSSVLVSRSLVALDYKTNSFRTNEILVKNIETIKVRKKNSIAIGAVSGFVSGLVLGIIIGYVQGDDPEYSSPFQSLSRTAGQKAFIWGIPLSLAGAGIGAGIGSIRVNFPIHGKVENFRTHKNTLNNYSIKKLK
jgi:hypothetical protein